MNFVFLILISILTGKENSGARIGQLIEMNLPFGKLHRQMRSPIAQLSASFFSKALASFFAPPTLLLVFQCVLQTTNLPGSFLFVLIGFLT